MTQLYEALELLTKELTTMVDASREPLEDHWPDLADALEFANDVLAKQEDGE